MKVTTKGYDPDLGRKFFEEYGGAVITGVKSETQVVIVRGKNKQTKEPMPAGLDAQQEHDWLKGHLTWDDF